MGAEVELKLATSRSGLRKAMALPWLRKLAGENISRKHLTSVYFDTDDFTLRDHGVSLRVRKSGGQTLQTIKANATAPVERAEWESEIDRDRPRLELARSTALAPLLTDEIASHLKPVFESDVERVTMPLHIGRSEIELAFDQGRVATADRHVEIAEIELELKQGDLGDAAHLARKLGHSVPITLGARAKAEWGYALLEGTIDHAVSAAPIAIAPDATAAEAFTVVGFACLRQIAGNELAVRHGHGEGVHQMRVGLRRFRAALSLFKEMLGGVDLDRLKGELKWLTEQLGPARDHDVFLAKTVAPYRKAHPNRPEFAGLAQELEKQRGEGFATARRAVENPRYHRLLLDAAVWLLDGEWQNTADALVRALRQRPAITFAQEELGRRTRKIVKRVRKVDRLDPMRRHKLRIAVKKVRYGHEFFASLAPMGGRKAARRSDRALKNLQSALGSLNDQRVHLYWARDFAKANGAARKAFAAGYLVGRESARGREMLAEARRAGRQLKKAA